MPEQHLFEYSVIRLVPRVEREEFVNIGIILLCSPQKFIGSRIVVNEPRLRTLWPHLEIEVLREHINSFELICAGGYSGGPIGLLPISDRFRWLTASRSTIIQTSNVHPGLCVDAQQTLDRLVNELVQC